MPGHTNDSSSPRQAQAATRYHSDPSVGTIGSKQFNQLMRAQADQFSDDEASEHEHDDLDEDVSDNEHNKRSDQERRHYHHHRRFSKDAKGHGGYEDDEWAGPFEADIVPGQVNRGFGGFGLLKNDARNKEDFLGLEEEGTGGFLGALADIFRPYKSGYYIKHDLAQPLRGFISILKGVGQLIKGVLQIVTTPFIWLFRMLPKGTITSITGFPKIEESKNIQYWVAEVNRVANVENLYLAAEKERALLGICLSTHHIFRAARVMKQPSGISDELESMYFADAMKPDTLVKNLINRMDYMSLFLSKSGNGDARINVDLMLDGVQDELSQQRNGDNSRRNSEPYNDVRSVFSSSEQARSVLDDNNYATPGAVPVPVRRPSSHGGNVSVSRNPSALWGSSGVGGQRENVVNQHQGAAPLAQAATLPTSARAVR